MHEFDPPLYFNIISICSWLAHLASGLLHITISLFKTRFRYAYIILSLLYIITRWPIMQKVHRHNSYIYIIAPIAYSV